MALRVEKLVSGAKGLAHTEEGRTILLSSVLPGEVVNYTITKSTPKYLEARVNDIEKPSNLRIEPLCPLYNSCGGCDFLFVSP